MKTPILNWPRKTLAQTRFATLRKAMADATGARVRWLDEEGGAVIVDGVVHRSLQAAIDSNSRFLPADFVNP